MKKDTKLSVHPKEGHNFNLAKALAVVVGFRRQVRPGGYQHAYITHENATTAERKLDVLYVDARHNEASVPLSTCPHDT